MPYGSRDVQEDDDHHDKSRDFMDLAEKLFALWRGIPQFGQRYAEKLDGVLRETRAHEARHWQHNHAQIQKPMDPFAQLVLKLCVANGGSRHRMGDAPA